MNVTNKRKIVTFLELSGALSTRSFVRFWNNSNLVRVVPSMNPFNIKSEKPKYNRRAIKFLLF